MHRCVRLTKQVSIFDWVGTLRVICPTTVIASVYMHPRRNVLIGYMYVCVSFCPFVVRLEAHQQL